MSKCIIIAPLYRGEEPDWLCREDGDLLICADGGYAAARRCGLEPDLVVGDFDSMPEGHQVQGEVLRLPVHKDDTDMAVCFREGRKRGYRSFRIAGALGGRMDHTLANLQCLYDCALRGEEAWLCDRHNRLTVLLPGEYVISRIPERKLSLLAWTQEVRGVTLRGTEWELTDHTLSSRYPLGVSNEIRGEQAHLSFTEGALVLIHAQDAAADRSDDNT
ncbi:MAG: thiamine diphosphokinase [Clostridia bacterium]|nr:thiamine diphosphokinase [Clostridia bacterium]